MFQQSLAHNPQNTRILFSMGIEMANRQRFQEAEHYFRKALEGEPLHLTSRVALGRALHDQGKFIEAITVYEGVQQAGHWNQLLKKNLDAAYQEAMKRYQQKISDDPNNARLHYSLGVLHGKRGNLLGGIAQFEQAIALDPLYKNALFNLASSYEAQGDDARAIIYYERMVNLASPKTYEDYHACNHLGEIYQRQGEVLKSEDYFQKAHQLKSVLTIE